jgi:hypothetical protein
MKRVAQRVALTVALMAVELVGRLVEKMDAMKEMQ